MNHPTQPSKPSTAEFDDYAPGYAAGMDNPVKSLLGDSADAFVAVKLNWLLRRFPELRSKGRDFRILDYGCGTATLLRLMAGAGLQTALCGCDISRAMMQEAQAHWPAGLPVPELLPQEGARTPLEPGTVDLAIISAVLHHVPVDERAAVYAELHRVLRPGGHLVVFEHNPLNPVTRYVVAHTEIDRNAILLRAGEVCGALRRTGFDKMRTQYLMFFPPRLSALAGIEAALGWMPMGAQYAVTARRR